MAVGTPQNAEQVESRIKADVQREAPDSNPYLTVHWLRSLIAGIARRIFDFYLDLNRTERRLFPDTADDETAPRWGNIYVGPENPASAASGPVVATGTIGGTIPVGAILTAGGQQYNVTEGATIATSVLNVLSITRSGTTATVTTDGTHNLSSFVPVTIVGADQPEYNVTNAAITVTGINTFTYEVSGAPITPATGTITSTATIGVVTVISSSFGENTNLDPDTPLQLQSPIANVDDTLYVTFSTVGGGSEKESTDNYKARYLEKIRDPVAHFNEADIVSEAKTVTGVTRVFVEPSGTVIGTIGVASITRNGSVATVTTVSPHGFESGQQTSISGANESEYNVNNVRIIVESNTVFHYIVLGIPVTPATGSISATTSIPLGQVRTFFMRDNDDDPIPSAAEVQTVKDAVDSIRPANTATFDNIVEAPTPIAINYTFSELTPNTPEMRAAIDANIAQFHEEETTVGKNVDEDAYRAAIKNTVDPVTGDELETFDLTIPTGDITISSGEIATKGLVSF